MGGWGGHQGYNTRHDIAYTQSGGGRDPSLATEHTWYRYRLKLTSWSDADKLFELERK